MSSIVTCDDCDHENEIFDTRCANCDKPLQYDEDRNVRYVSDTESGDVSSNFSFVVEFECLNCNSDWEYKFKYGDRVPDKTGRYGEVRATIDQSSKYPDNAPATGRHRIIYCENCGSEPDVRIANRIPAEEYEKHD